MRFTRAPISQWSECRGFVLLRHYKERSTWLRISPIVERALRMFYLAGSRRPGCSFVCSPAGCVLGVAAAEPHLLTANGRSRISQVCQPLPRFSRQQSPTPLSPVKASTLERIFKVFLHFTESFCFKSFLFISNVGFLWSCLLSLSMTRGTQCWLCMNPLLCVMCLRVKLI